MYHNFFILSIKHKIGYFIPFFTYDFVGKVHIWLYLHIPNLTVLLCESYESKKYPFPPFSPTHQLFQLEAILPVYTMILGHS